jgi:FimV-like protein
VKTEGSIVNVADTSCSRTALLLDRAEHLTQSGDLEEASRLLSLLLEEAEGPAKLRARAMLGVTRIQQGRLREAQDLLSAVVADPAAEDWSGRAEALADLGLAHLAAGDEEQGLRCLHDARQSFASGGQQEQLARCLRNEARYLAFAGKRDSAQEAHQPLMKPEGAQVQPDQGSKVLTSKEEAERTGF